MPGPRQRSIGLATLAVGAAALVGQTVLVRELMVSFYGTELALACALGCWLLFVAMGALSAASFLRAFDRPLLLARFAVIALCAGLGAGFLLARCVRPVLGAAVGQFLPLRAMLVGCAAAALPAGFPVGFFFTAACRWQESVVAGIRGRGISRLYVAEAAGSGLAGALLSFFLLGYVGPGALAAGAVLLLLVVGAADAFLRGEGWAALAWAAFALVVCAVSAATGPMLARMTVAARWRTYSTFDFVDAQDTRYEHVELGERQGEFQLVRNGRAAAQFPDTPGAQRRAALLLTQHPDPLDVMVVGGGLGGLCQQMLTAPIRSLHYVEPDPQLADFLLKRLPQALRAPLSDRRFALHEDDGRHFLQARPAGPGTFDLIVIAVGDPTSAADSRYYTVEFCRLLKKALRPGGVAAFCGVTGSENYGGSSAVRDYTACIYRTLRDSFAEVVVRPGDEFCFFASDTVGAATSSPEELAARFERLGLKPDALKQGFELVEFPPERTRWASDLLEQALPGALVNTDARPVVFTLFLAVQRRYAYQAGQGRIPSDSSDLFARVRRTGRGWFLLPFAVLLASLAVLRVVRGRPAAVPAGSTFAVLTTGVFGLSAEMFIVYGYQVAFGYVYRDIGLIVGLFMVGLAAGGWVTGRSGGGRTVSLLIVLDALQGALILAMPAAVQVLSRSAYGFMALAPAAGFLTGATFPLAARASLRHARDSGLVAGALGAADHLGAMAGAACAGLLLVPAVGLWGAATVLALVKCASLAGLVLASAGAAPHGSTPSAA